MPFARTQIDPSWDRNWIAQNHGFTSHQEELDENGSWLFAAPNVEAALISIENYPVNYLAKRLPEARVLIEGRGREEFNKGFVMATGPLAGHVLQCRDTEDRTNWLTSQVSYSAAVALGLGAEPGAHFRTAANETINCTYAEGSEVLLAMAQWGAAIMARTWALKDAAAAAANIDELDAVLADLESGWPSTAAV